MKRNKKCEKIQKWLLFHSGENFSVSIKKHLESCASCQQFVQEEKWIQLMLKNTSSQNIEISMEHSLVVKQAIWQVSQELSRTKKKETYFFPKVAGAITAISILLLFFFVPLFGGENFLGFQVNQQLESYIQNTETVGVAVIEDTNVAMGLKFVSQYVKTTEEKSFYYSTNSLSKENYLLIQYLSNKTSIKATQVHDWLVQKGYAYLLRKLNLPYKKTVAEIKAYISQFRQATDIPSFSLDGYVERVDYDNQSIWIDSYNKEIKVDFLTLQAIHIGYYANFSLQEKEDMTSCVKIEKSLFPTTILTGKVDLHSETEIRLVGNPTPIQVTSKTIFSPVQESSEKQSLDALYVRVRVMVHGDQLIAIAIRPIRLGTERTMSGSLDQVYKYGFTMENLMVSFCFESQPKVTLTNLPPKTIVTVTGKDFGAYFIVSSFNVIANPDPKIPGTTYYLAKADIGSRMAKQVSSDITFDFVVSGDEKDLYLASGKKLSNQNGKFPVGSKIKMTNIHKSGQLKISWEEIGTSSIFQGNVIFQEKLENGCYVYTSEKKDKQFILFPKKGTSLPETGTLQGVVIQYNHFAIVIDYRLFQIRLLQTTKGLVTKMMDETRMAVLDNGVMIKTDDWTQISNGSLGVGKTLQLFGVYEQGIFKAYLVTIEKEMVMFKGVIVEHDSIKKTIKLDSGQTISYNFQTSFQLQKKQVQIGDLVYVKAYLNDMDWIAMEIVTPRDGFEDLGDI